MRTARRLTVLAVSLALLTAGPVTPVHAAGPAQLPLEWEVNGQLATPQQVVDFWTLENLSVANGSGHSPTAVSSGHDDALSSPTPKTGLAGRTVGKMFTLKSTTDTASIPDGLLRSTCSGNVVNSANKSVVLTAGHCVKTEVPPLREVILNSVFIPGFDGTTLDAKAALNPNGYPDAAIAPYGVWAVTNVFLTSTWGYAPYFALGQDMAALTVKNPADIRPIQDVTGGQQVAFSRPRAGQRTVIGYSQDNTRFWYHSSRNNLGSPINSNPSAGPINHGVLAADQRENDGKVMLQTTGTAVQGAFPYLDPRIPSALGAGGSGGPWFEEYDPVTGVGIQTAVSSRNEGDPNAADVIAAWKEGPQLVGTYFESQQQDAYAAAAAATP
ncbi:trypsin-like serine peptidase [Streptosporangium amethystogenes]|uniref:trypsin-like serine peptidase n=1 Tax=Streptosporangium amethystogenes TaxID=2002 RepID=UPI0037B26873